MRIKTTRRTFLRGMAGAAILSPFWGMLPHSSARAQDFEGARRFIVFYFPDGVPGPSQSGMASLWHATGQETSFSLPELMSPLEKHRDTCIFFNNLDMGRTDEGSHPGGARKLLTAVDHGQGRSIDWHLAQTVGSSAPHRHIYLGAQANTGGASGDKHISYIHAGQSIAPQDNPVVAFEQVLAGVASDTPMTPVMDSMLDEGERARFRGSVLDRSMQEITDLRGRLGQRERQKLETHLESIRELEQHIERLEEPGPGGASGPGCEMAALESGGYSATRAHDPELFPDIMRMQIDVMVQAMACGQSKVGVLQASSHTSELIMSRFVRPSGQAQTYDMRSHQASHYGANHDPNKIEFANFVAQRHWFIEQFAYLLDELSARPEGDGTMLDYSAVLLCTEVCDGNTHSHSNMPFVLAGGGGGKLRTGRLIDARGASHGDLFAAIAHAMGEHVQGYGQRSSGPLYGVWSG